MGLSPWERAYLHGLKHAGIDDLEEDGDNNRYEGGDESGVTDKDGGHGDSGDVNNSRGSNRGDGDDRNGNGGGARSCSGGGVKGGDGDSDAGGEAPLT